MGIDPRRLGLPGRLAAWGALTGLLATAGCEGATGPPGPAGPAGENPTTPTVIGRSDDAPRVIVAIQGLSGASGAAGTFEVGDRISVHFTLTKEDGSSWSAKEMSSGRALVSGPTFSYQRVIPEVDDVQTSAVETVPGTYVYTFPQAIPASYLPPFNDSPSFGADQGELTGEALLDGTYTLGLSFAWEYQIEGDGKSLHIRVVSIDG